MSFGLVPVRKMNLTCTLLAIWLIGILVAPCPASGAVTGPNVVACGGTNVFVPADLTNAVGVACGQSVSLALLADRTVRVWGGQTVPGGLTNVVAVAAGREHYLALGGDGTVIAWGDNLYGQTNVPADLANVVALAAGDAYSLALRAEGTVVAWGSATVPAGLTNVVAISAAGMNSLALRADGTVISWGGQTNVPADLTDVVAVAAAFSHNLALRTDGTVVSWDSETNGPTAMTNIRSIAGAYFTDYGVESDGTLVKTGLFDPALPTLTNVVAVAANELWAALAVFGDCKPFVTGKLANREMFAGGTAYFRIEASGSAPLSYQWQFNGTNLPNVTNMALVLTNFQPVQAGAYNLVVSNLLGVTTSSTGVLSLVPALILDPPHNQIAYVGGTATFRVRAEAKDALSYQWRFNGAKLAGATDSSLVLSHLRLEQEGAYSVEVSNVWGVVTSVEASLSVGLVARWGSEVDVPPGLTNVIAIAAGESQSLALRSDGKVVAWGDNEGNRWGQTAVPAALTNVIAVAGGTFHTVALVADGTIVPWGRELTGVFNIPNAIAVSASQDQNLALLSDGTLALWGNSVWGGSPTRVGPSNVVAIAMGALHTLALIADGTVAAWGDNRFGQTNVPPNIGAVVAIAVGGVQSLALQADGTVVGWGQYWDGSSSSTYVPVTVPAGLTNAVAIAAGDNHCLALRADGTVIAWGNGGNGETNIPVGLTNVVAIAAGGHQSLALIGDEHPALAMRMRNPSWTGNSFQLSLPTQSGRVYALEYKASFAESNWTQRPLVPGHGAIQVLTDPTALGTHRFYRVRRW